MALFSKMIRRVVKHENKKAESVPFPDVPHTKEGLDEIINYYGDVSLVVQNLKRILWTDFRNWVAQEALGNAITTKSAIEDFIGFKESDNGFEFANFNRGKGRERDELNYHLNQAKDKKNTPEQRLYHLDKAQQLMRERV